MRKLWIVALVLMLGFSFAMAQTVHWADQKTITWDAPLTLVDGSPISSEDIIAYNVYLRHEDATVSFLEITSTIPYTVTVPEGIHYVGVSAIRYIGGAGTPFESEVLWSDFLLGYGRSPVAPSGLSVVP